MPASEVGSNSADRAENTAGKISAPPGSSSSPLPPWVIRYSLVSTMKFGLAGSRTIATHLWLPCWKMVFVVFTLNPQPLFAVKNAERRSDSSDPRISSTTWSNSPETWAKEPANDWP